MNKFLVLLIAFFAFNTAFAADIDGDLISDTDDNCVNIANPTQLDTDDDGYGNICDGDLDQSGLVTVRDVNLFYTVINQQAGQGPLQAAADFNGSGLVTAQDWSLLRAMLNKKPGPSGLAP